MQVVVSWEFHIGGGASGMSRPPGSAAVCWGLALLVDLFTGLQRGPQPLK